MSGIQCFICEKITPIIDDHHIWPRSAGGEDGPTVKLCSTCHSGIHRQALNSLSKTAKTKQFFTQDQLTRALPLIQYLIAAIQHTRENGKQNQPAKLTIQIESDLMQMLHLLKADAGITNLSSFCAMVLRAYVARKI